MKLYDSFVKNQHPQFIQDIMVRFNKNILNEILKILDTGKKSINILEIGPGKGYFYKSVKKNLKCKYFAVDRNELIARSLDIQDYYICELPNCPKFSEKFDVIFVSYVAEHLKNGLELFEFLQNYKVYLNKGGIIVLFTPDTMKMGMEFWNIDYTHIFPTNKRNVTMSLREAGFKDINIFNINGLLTIRKFTSRFIYLMIRILIFFYNYKVFDFFLYCIGINNGSKDSLFYKIYCFAKEENLMFVARN